MPPLRIFYEASHPLDRPRPRRHEVTTEHEQTTNRRPLVTKTSIAKVPLESSLALFHGLTETSSTSALFLFSPMIVSKQKPSAQIWQSSGLSTSYKGYEPQTRQLRSSVRMRHGRSRKYDSIKSSSTRPNARSTGHRIL